MTRTLLAGLCVAGGLSVCSAAVSLGNPFVAIIRRNVFGLRPMPPPQAQTTTKAPEPKPLLTGITSILGIKQALLEIDFPPHPSQPAKKEYCILAEGQQHGPIEVLHIDEQHATVEVNNSGTVSTLKFEKATPQPAQPTQPRRPPTFPAYRLARHYP